MTAREKLIAHVRMYGAPIRDLETADSAFHRVLDAALAEAVAAEREACAQLVQSSHVHGRINEGDKTRQLIAKAIRARGEP